MNSNNIEYLAHILYDPSGEYASNEKFHILASANMNQKVIMYSEEMGIWTFVPSTFAKNIDVKDVEKVDVVAYNVTNKFSVNSFRKAESLFGAFEYDYIEPRLSFSAIIPCNGEQLDRGKYYFLSVVSHDHTVIHDGDSDNPKCAVYEYRGTISHKVYLTFLPENYTKKHTKKLFIMSLFVLAMSEILLYFFTNNLVFSQIGLMITVFFGIALNLAINDFKEVKAIEGSDIDYNRLGYISKDIVNTFAVVADMALSSGETVDFTKSIFLEERVSDFAKVYTMKKFYEVKDILDEGLLVVAQKYFAEKELLELSAEIAPCYNFLDNTVDSRYETLEKIYLNKE